VGQKKSDSYEEINALFYITTPKNGECSLEIHPTISVRRLKSYSSRKFFLHQVRVSLDVHVNLISPKRDLARQPFRDS